MQSTVRSLIRELRVVCFVESCWEFVRRIARYLNRAECCKEFVRRIARYLIKKELYGVCQENCEVSD